MGNSTNFKQELISRLRDLVDLRGESLASIEKQLGKGRGYIGDALRGEKRLSLDVVLDMLEVLEINPQEFFAGPVEPEVRLVAISQRYDEASAKRDAAYALAPAPSSEVAETADGDEDPLSRIERNLAAGEDPAQMAATLCSLVRLLVRKGTFDGHELLWTLQDLCRRWPLEPDSDPAPAEDPEGE